MIVIDFIGSVVEGQISDHRPGDPLVVFVIQYPNRPVNPAIEIPTLNGRPLVPIAQSRGGGSRGNPTHTLVEYEVREPGVVELTSWLNLKGDSKTFRFGVEVEDRGITLKESAEAHTGHQAKWFFSGEFLDYHPGQTRTLFSRTAVPDPEPLSVWDRLGSDSF